MKTVTLLIMILFLIQCKMNKDQDSVESQIPVVTNSTATFVFDGVSSTLDCLANRNTDPDGCGKISVFLFKSEQKSITFRHFPEDASGTYNVGDGNTQNACNQIYAYVSPGGFSANLLS